LPAILLFPDALLAWLPPAFFTYMSPLNEPWTQTMRFAFGEQAGRVSSPGSSGKRTTLPPAAFIT
jgi:hypothetical protein